MKEIYNTFVELYNQGYSCKNIAKQCNYSDAWVEKILKRLNVFKSTKIVPNINRDYFNNLDTDNKYYILGFIAADGNLSKDGNRLSIKLQSKDIDILEKIKEELQYEGKIKHYLKTLTYKYVNKEKVYFYSNSACSLVFNNKTIYQDLFTYGLTPNKSLSLTIDKRLKDNKHFWRGVFDGDGCLYYKNNCVQITIVGTENTCISFLDFAKIYVPNVRSKVKKQKKVYTVTITSTKAIKILDVLYDNSQIHLNRKYEKYLNVKNNYNPNLKYLDW